jgi:coenzyme F420-0:L-glutamate ligase/coenzyme F420-1:gamma-L-glutamate ligase
VTDPVVSLEIRPVTGIGDISPGDDLGEIISTAAPWLRDGDVLVVTSKIVSKSEGRLVEVPVGGPEREAARERVLADETARPVARRGHTRIVATRHGFVLASAGIDASNVDRSRLVLLPLDPDASARSLRAALRARLGVDVAVIITDTMGRPWRQGLMDLAIGAAGIAALRDHRGEVDAYGNELHITQMAAIDELSSAAELVKGKCDQVPVAVVRGYFARPTADDGPGAAALVRDSAHDLFSLGTAEARRAGLSDAARLGTPAALSDEPADLSAVARAVADLATALSTGTGLTHFADPLLRDKLATLVAAEIRGGPVELVLCVAAEALPLGVDVHRLRCALAAEGLVSGWRPVTAAHLADVGIPAPADDVAMALVWIAAPARPTVDQS